MWQEPSSFCVTPVREALLSFSTFKLLAEIENKIKLLQLTTYYVHDQDTFVNFFYSNTKHTKWHLSKFPGIIITRKMALSRKWDTSLANSSFFFAKSKF